MEHDAAEIWRSVVDTVRKAIVDAGIDAADIAAIGITNQRETAVVWDRRSGTPLHRAIVWQDRRTAEMCESLKADGYEKLFSAKTGLLLDPYFSGTKLRWLLDNVDGLREKAEAGDVCFGTIDSWLIYNLTGGRVHATEATNASRTLLYNIDDGAWDEELLGILRIPAAMLPEVRECADDFGRVDKTLFGVELPILGVARRPAGGGDGQCLLRARHDEIHLRHRLFCPVEHRQGSCFLLQPDADDDRLSA